MKIELFTYNCIGCGRCIRNCPAGALKMVNNGLCCFVNISDANLCTGCGRCERNCPAGAIRIVGKNK